MSIVKFPAVFPGQEGNAVRVVSMAANDSYSTITAANFLKSVESQGFQFRPNDLVLFNYGTTLNMLALFTVSITGSTITLEAYSSEGNVITPVEVGTIPVFRNTDGQIGEPIATMLAATNLNVAGILATIAPGDEKGFFRLVPQANAGNFEIDITNAPCGQPTVFTLPDPGQATANISITAGASLPDTIPVFLNAEGQIGTPVTTMLAPTNLNVDGVLATIAPTEEKGFLRLAAVDNAGDFEIDISNESFGQSTVISIPDSGEATGTFAVNIPNTSGLKLSSALVNAVHYPVVFREVVATSAQLASGGVVILLQGSPGTQYLILNMGLVPAAGLSGGGGNRDVAVADASFAYTLIPAATAQAPVNSQWGSTETPYPAATSIHRLTTAGENVYIGYDGGTTDYTAGEILVWILAIEKPVVPF